MAKTPKPLRLINLLKINSNILMYIIPREAAAEEVIRVEELVYCRFAFQSASSHDSGSPLCLRSPYPTRNCWGLLAERGGVRFGIVDSKAKSNVAKSSGIQETQPFKSIPILSPVD